MIQSLSTMLLVFLPAALAAPAPVAVAPHPMITAKATLEDRYKLQERGLKSDLSDITSELNSYVNSLVGTFPSYIASGVPNFFQDFPTGSAVESSLGINDDDLKATPTQVLNIP